MRAERERRFSPASRQASAALSRRLPKGDDHVGVADARLRGDADLQLQGIALRAQLLRAGEEKASTTGFSHAPRSERKRQASVTSAE